MKFQDDISNEWTDKPKPIYSSNFFIVFKTTSRTNGRTSRNQYTLSTFSKLGAKSWEHNQKISIAMQNGYHWDFAAII